MGLSGKYDFKGIKEKGAIGLKAALSTVPYLGWLAKVPGLSKLLLEFISNWLANKGLIVANVGMFYVDGELDQNALDKALDHGWKAVENPDLKLTPEQIKAIDDAVIKAADKAIPYNSRPITDRV